MVSGQWFSRIEIERVSRRTFYKTLRLAKEDGADPKLIEDARKIMRHNDGRYLICRKKTMHGTTVAGMCYGAVAYISGDTGIAITFMHVMQDHRRQGIATSMLDSLADEFPCVSVQVPESYTEMQLFLRNWGMICHTIMSYPHDSCLLFTWYRKRELWPVIAQRRHLLGKYCCHVGRTH